MYAYNEEVLSLNSDQFLFILTGFLSIPSVSTRKKGQHLQIGSVYNQFAKKNLQILFQLLTIE